MLWFFKTHWGEKQGPFSNETLKKKWMTADMLTKAISTQKLESRRSMIHCLKRSQEHCENAWSMQQSSPGVHFTECFRKHTHLNFWSMLRSAVFVDDTVFCHKAQILQSSQMFRELQFATKSSARSTSCPTSLDERRQKVTLLFYRFECWAHLIWGGV